MTRETIVAVVLVGLFLAICFLAIALLKDLNIQWPVSYRAYSPVAIESEYVVPDEVIVDEVIPIVELEVEPEKLPTNEDDSFNLWVDVVDSDVNNHRSPFASLTQTGGMVA